jgi:hypothetical protein
MFNSLQMPSSFLITSTNISSKEAAILPQTSTGKTVLREEGNSGSPVRWQRATIAEAISRIEHCTLSLFIIGQASLARGGKLIVTLFCNRNKYLSKPSALLFVWYPSEWPRRHKLFGRVPVCPRLVSGTKTIHEQLLFASLWKVFGRVPDFFDTLPKQQESVH